MKELPLKPPNLRKRYRVLMNDGNYTNTMMIFNQEQEIAIMQEGTIVRVDEVIPNTMHDKRQVLCMHALMRPPPHLSLCMRLLLLGGAFPSFLERCLRTAEYAA
jgi:Replication factor-A protein 1, N-terminal domain